MPACHSVCVQAHACSSPRGSVCSAGQCGGGISQRASGHCPPLRLLPASFYISHLQKAGTSEPGPGGAGGLRLQRKGKAERREGVVCEPHLEGGWPGQGRRLAPFQQPCSLRWRRALFKGALCASTLGSSHGRMNQRAAWCGPKTWLSLPQELGTFPQKSNPVEAPSGSLLTWATLPDPDPGLCTSLGGDP